MLGGSWDLQLLIRITPIKVQTYNLTDRGTWEYRGVSKATLAINAYNSN